MTTNTCPAPLDGASCDDWFSIVLLPDTQCYTADGAPPDSPACGDGAGSFDGLQSQMDWISRNRARLRIAAVVGLGDIVQCTPTGNEWSNAVSAYTVLQFSGLPFVPLAGNHDFDACEYSTTRAMTRYDAAIGPLMTAPWVGGSSYPSGTVENLFVTFDALGDRYLVLALEYYPRPAAVEWARSVLDANGDARVLVATHAFLRPDGTRDPGTVADGTAPTLLWDSLLAERPNLIGVVSGHLPGVAHRVDSGTNGNAVPQMLSNFQWYAHGGSGYLRILHVFPHDGLIAARTCSPFLNAELTDPGTHQFTVPFGP